MQVTHPGLLIYNEVCHSLSQCWPHISGPSTKFMTKILEAACQIFPHVCRLFSQCSRCKHFPNLLRCPMIELLSFNCPSFHVLLFHVGMNCLDFVQALTIQVCLLVSWPRSADAVSGCNARQICTALHNFHKSCIGVSSEWDL